MEKIIGFVGYECEDIVLYLAKIMCALGKKTAIIDRTEQEILLEVLGMQEEKEKTGREGEVAGIWITGQGVSHRDFDVVFYLFGYRLIHPKLYECEALVMVTDGVPAHSSLFRKIGSWNRKQYLLIRNIVPMKHTEHYLAVLANNENNYCEIPYDEKDIRMRCSLSPYAVGGVRYLSTGMKRALIVLMEFLSSGYPERTIKEVIKKL